MQLTSIIMLTYTQHSSTWWSINCQVNWLEVVTLVFYGLICWSLPTLALARWDYYRHSCTCYPSDLNRIKLEHHLSKIKNLALYGKIQHNNYQQNWSGSFREFFSNCSHSSSKQLDTLITRVIVSCDLTNPTLTAMVIDHRYTHFSKVKSNTGASNYQGILNSSDWFNWYQHYSLVDVKQNKTALTPGGASTVRSTNSG
jgi:hypothetical protein